MDSKAEQKTIFFIGILAVVIWLAYLFYAPPFADFPKTTDPSVQNQVIKAFIRAYLIIGVGVLGGILLLYRKQAGYWISIAMAIYMLAGRVSAACSHPGGFFKWAKTIYGELLFLSPVGIIHKDIIAPLFFLTSLVILLYLCFAGRRKKTFNKSFQPTAFSGG